MQHWLKYATLVAKSLLQKKIETIILPTQRKMKEKNGNISQISFPNSIFLKQNFVCSIYMDFLQVLEKFHFNQLLGRTMNRTLPDSIHRLLPFVFFKKLNFYFSYLQHREELGNLTLQMTKSGTSLKDVDFLCRQVDVLLGMSVGKEMIFTTC